MFCCWKPEKSSANYNETKNGIGGQLGEADPSLLTRYINSMGDYYRAV